jgi:hypothetical protein
MPTALPEGYVFHLPHGKPSPHVYGDATTIPPSQSISTFEQREWTCKTCGVVRITVIQPDGRAYRKWRLPENDVQMAWMPACGQKIGSGK